MLETVEADRCALVVYRFADYDYEDNEDFLQTEGLDPEQTGEMAALVRDRGIRDRLQECCDQPFRLKWRLSGTSPRATRFSDGTFPVFYSSLEIETAKTEMRRWFPIRIGRPKVPRTQFMVCFSCSFRGQAKDLRRKLDEWPELVSDDYGFCNRLGREAVDTGLDGIVAPSARCPRGANVPVFRRLAIRDPELLETVAVTYDPATNRVTIKRHS